MQRKVENAKAVQAIVGAFMKFRGLKKPSFHTGKIGSICPFLVLWELLEFNDWRYRHSVRLHTRTDTCKSDNKERWNTRQKDWIPDTNLYIRFRISVKIDFRSAENSQERIDTRKYDTDHGTPSIVTG